MSQIQLGQIARDKITGFEGVVTCIATYEHSCRRIALTSRTLDKDGKIQDIDFDEPQIDVVDTNPIMTPPTFDAPRFLYGQPVIDPITKFEGKVTARANFLNGCVRICVQADYNKKEAKRDTGVWYPETQVEPNGKLLKPKTEDTVAPRRGGPSMFGNEQSISSPRGSSIFGLFIVLLLVGVLAKADTDLIGTAQAKGLFIKDRIEVTGFDDPTIKGVACYTTRYVRTMTLADDSAESSLSCRRIGKIEGSLTSQSDIFSQNKGFLSINKTTVVDRFYDAKRNVLVYLSYTKSWGSKNPAHSISVVSLAE